MFKINSIVIGLLCVALAIPAVAQAIPKTVG